jgi:hypothetical protein
VEQEKANAFENQAIKEFTDPVDIAALAVFFAGPHARTISGQQISIDGDSKAAQWPPRPTLKPPAQPPARLRGLSRHLSELQRQRVRWSSAHLAPEDVIHPSRCAVGNLLPKPDGPWACCV